MKYLKDMKTWGVLVAVLVVAFGYVSLPQQVQALDEKVNETAKEVDQKVEKVKEDSKDVEEALHMFITEQRTIQAEQHKREGLMLELIKANREN